jgi:SWI/SNF related-matrix-associated actin-dependent regulator of chromatin subfamily C
VDGTKDGSDNDGDSWTHEETLLLLEGLEKYNDNWNAIAEHVGTKSKAQCIHHFIRIPVEDGLLESIEVPEASVSSRVQSNGFSYSNSNGGISGLLTICSVDKLWLHFSSDGSEIYLPPFCNCDDYLS